ncbi:ArsB/NhaD family transporter [Campylobacter avium]|uniref:ArsB/NhaD family transporter n=1 Tax=Campylobacter avium TaxID=522485 RepID=UPI00255B8249|nr:ArsB/NhaD family transporter [Campylobacter avium]
MAYLLFITCMLFIYIRPFSLPIWFSSVLFAFLAYILSLLSFDDIIFVFSIVTDSTVALLALILLSMSFDKLGFFAHLASFIAFKKISSFSFFCF